VPFSPHFFSARPERKVGGLSNTVFGVARRNRGFVRTGLRRQHSADMNAPGIKFVVRQIPLFNGQTSQAKSNFFHKQSRFFLS
jgi:hypothetical protein